MDMGKELRVIEVEEFDDSELTDVPEPAETPQPATRP
jgi:hypothetical protein